MKSTLCMLLAFAALVLTVREGEPLIRASSAATVIQHKKPTPRPTPPPGGIISPGDVGGAQRTKAAAAGARVTPTPKQPPQVIIPGKRGGTPRHGGLGNRTSGAGVRPTSNGNRSNQNLGARDSFGGEGFGGSRGRPKGSRISPATHSLETFEAFESEYHRTEFRRACDPAEQLRNELSGVYFGYVYFDGLDLRGEAGLRICGNKFTLFKGQRTASGVVTTTITSGYTAAAFRFTSVTGFAVPLMSLPKTVSVTVNRLDETTSFRSTREEPTKFTFSGPKFRFLAPGL